jgi:Zn-dependent peptidase ImmA (M78 family)
MPYSSDTKHLLIQSGIDIYTRVPTSPISLRRVTPYLNLKYLKMSFDRNTCGMLVHSNKGSYIFINADQPYTRRRFSVAHEIGHYFLGHESDVTQENDQNRYEEVQANRFASCLLMPDELFHFVHKEQTSIKEMANWLRVSPISVAIRCTQLGYRRMEAELIKNDYFLASEEIAASSSRSRSRRKEMPKQQEVIPDPPFKQHPRNDTLWNKNVEMVDRLRRIYGYD